jgi:hypothetical protein
MKYYDLIAQLGEHYLDRVGVTGSIPVQITILKLQEALYNKASFLYSAYTEAIPIHAYLDSTPEH